jgi:hypothetical protein
MPIGDQGTSPSRLGGSVAGRDAHDHLVAGLHGPAERQPRESPSKTKLAVSNFIMLAG